MALSISPAMPRKYKARRDASTGSIEKNIENTYGLPKGSVNINNRGGRNARSDKKIANLRKDYD